MFCCLYFKIKNKGHFIFDLYKWHLLYVFEHVVKIKIYNNLKYKLLNNVKKTFVRKIYFKLKNNVSYNLKRRKIYNYLFYLFRVTTRIIMT